MTKKLTPKQFAEAMQRFSLPTTSPEPTPIGYVDGDERQKILTHLDWLQMYLDCREHLDPTPDWLEKLIGIPVEPDDVRGVVAGLIRTAEAAVKDAQPIKKRNATRSAAKALRDQRICAAALEDQYEGQPKKVLHVRLATRFSVSVDTVRRALR